MTFEEAFDRAVRAFYEGAKMTESEKVKGKSSVYNNDYFGGLSENLRKSKKAKLAKKD